MILLHPDYLIFETSDGDAIPCSAEEVTLELMGDSAQHLDMDTVREAAAAVVHYFRHDLQKDHVSVAEFAAALEKVLAGLGFTVTSSGVQAGDRRICVLDLKQLASTAAPGGELIFFGRLREELAMRLEQSPNVLRLEGLRPCVKALAGARRWTCRCQTLNDQIVEFLRECFTRSSPNGCELVVH
ncbi:MAG TPA: hypothetical protein VEH27_03730 [Methylomirabilota bacterium]|nr:hypothetical protein [Methylomirabilota bacterium]